MTPVGRRAVLLLAGWLVVALAAVPPAPPVHQEWSGTHSSLVPRSAPSAKPSHLRNRAAPSFLETAERTAGAGDAHFCIRGENMPTLSYCPQIDYHTAVLKTDLKPLPDGWQAAPYGSDGQFYFWNKAGVTQWVRPESRTFALLERKAEALVQQITNMDKVGCERTVRATVCALMFPRCEPMERRDDNWKPEDTKRVRGDASVMPVEKIYPVCESFCDAAGECLVEDPSSKAEPLGPQEAHFAMAMGRCGRNPLWATENCCCSHAWGLAQSHGGNADGLQVASFSADAMAVYYNLKPYLGKKFILAMREPRVVDLFLGGKVGAVPLVRSDIDYSLNAVSPDGFDRVLGTLDKSTPYVDGPQSMAEFCPAMMAKERECPAVMASARTQLFPRDGCKYIMESMIVVKNAPNSNSDEGRYCAERADSQAKFLNGMCKGRIPNVSDGVCAMSKYASAKRTLPALFDAWFPRGAPPASTLVPAACSGREIVSGPEDTLFLYISSHGGDSGSLFIGESSAISKDRIRSAIKTLAERRRFKKMLIVLDACYSATIFEGWDDMPPRVYVVASAITDFVAFMQNAGDQVEEAFLSDLNLSPEVWDLSSLFTKAWLEDAMHRIPAGPGAEATVEAQCEFVRESLVNTIQGNVDFTADAAELPRCVGVSSEKDHFTTPLSDFFRRSYDAVPVRTPDETYARGISAAHQSFTNLHNLAMDRRKSDEEARAKKMMQKHKEKNKVIGNTPVPWPPRTVSRLKGNELDVAVLLAARVLVQSTETCEFLTDGLLERIPHLLYGSEWEPDEDHDDRYLMALREVFDGPKDKYVRELEELARSRDGLKKSEILAALNRMVPAYDDEESTVDDRVMLEYLLFYMMRAHTSDSRTELRRLTFLGQRCAPAKADSSVRQLMTVLAAVFRRLSAICSSADQSREALVRTLSAADVGLLADMSPQRLDDFATHAATEKGETGGVYSGLMGDTLKELVNVYVESLCGPDCQKNNQRFKGQCTSLLPFTAVAED